MFFLNTLTFQVPPFPTYIMGGEDSFGKGKKHIKRFFSVFDLLVVKKGCLYMNENGEKFDVSEGQYLILVPGLEHSSYKPCQTETNYYWLHFQLEVPYELKNLTDLNWGMIVKHEGTYIEAAKHIFHIPQYGKLGNKEFFFHEIERLVTLSETNTPEKRLKEQIVFQELMLQLQSDSIRIPTSAEQVTKQTITFLQTHYRNDHVKMEMISKELLFHPDYITRCMQKTIGVTPMQYLSSYRLSVAKQLLSTTNEKLEAIAKQVGISDSTYFSRLFKKVEGITPMEYRRLVKRECR